MISTLKPNPEHDMAHIYFYMLLGRGGDGDFAEVRVGMLGKKEG